MKEAQVTTAAVARPPISAFSWKRAGIAIGALIVFDVLINVYERLYGFSKGLDCSSPEYGSYWMVMLLAELFLEAITAASLWGWLWISRDRALERLAPAEELKRYWALGLFLLSYACAAYAGTSYFAEQGAAWHQTMIRDTDFTPTNIVEFYLSYPIYILFGVGSLLYATTRLPQFATAMSLPLAVLGGSPLMNFPNVALNEFGHTRWFVEELSVAPTHWGFVVFGWGTLAILGTWLQICPRVVALIQHLYHGKPFASAAEIIKDPQGSVELTTGA
ncbi:MAG: methane monooxygenase/ammonia monooxygenase subunit C [Methylacidiphilaceae bacterium]|nr:methane monooxygenase/ammonia monooxygenase subunit C [Candidatus Methylacidiphilaceae bacterium]